MAHVAKFAKGAVGHMAKHYDRSAKETIGNENVDLDRSYLNYNLAVHQQDNQLEFLHKRLSEVKLQNRKDVNILCDWVVTVPKELNEDFEEVFFQETYNFLEKKYGEENVVSAYVHNDEITPHMHFAFIPVVPDLKKGGFKVSAKECITKNDLKVFHQQLSNHLEKSFGYDVGVLNGATEGSNKTINELKAKEVEKSVKQSINDLVVLKNDINFHEKMLETVVDEISVKSAYVKECDRISDVSVMYPGYAEKFEVTEGKLFSKKKVQYVKVPVDKWEAKHICANERTMLEKSTEELINTSFVKEKNLFEEKNRNLQKEVKELNLENRKLENQNQKLEQDNEKIMRRINSVMKQLPDEMVERFAKCWNEQKEKELRSRNKSYSQEMEW